MKYAIMVLALVGILATPRLAAAKLTGNQFLDMCKNSELACLAYLHGWVDAFVITTIYMKDNNDVKKRNNHLINVCLSSEVTQTQKKMVLLKFLRDHPEMLHESSALLTYFAMKGAFPCR